LVDRNCLIAAYKVTVQTDNLKFCNVAGNLSVTEAQLEILQANTSRRHIRKLWIFKVLLARIIKSHNWQINNWEIGQVIIENPQSILEKGALSLIVVSRHFHFRRLGRKVTI